jgi:cysteine desulfurase / selenocysteine lyase
MDYSLSSAAQHLPKDLTPMPSRIVDWNVIRDDFPILNQKIGTKQLAYLDSSASTQVPQQVIDCLVQYHSKLHSNVHRGIHTLSQRATDAYESAREKVADFIQAETSRQCIFTRGATEGINLVAHSFGSLSIQPGDEIITTLMEHHSNIVPWQMLAERSGAILKAINVTDNGDLDLDHFRSILSERTKLVALTHVSNVLGTINPVAEFVRIAREAGAVTLVDGCQAMLHTPVSMKDIDPDFYVFSGHKMCAPTGVGVLYMKADWLDKLPPFLGGGDMISSVSLEKTVYNVPPYKFEAGTPPIAAAVALGAAIDYLRSIGQKALLERETELCEYFEEKGRSVEFLNIFGSPRSRAGVFSFEYSGVHHHDVGTILDSEGVAVRIGQHCAEPLMNVLGVSGTTRASLAFYNTKKDIDAFFEALTVVDELYR